jgi:hypothetical protein
MIGLLIWVAYTVALSPANKRANKDIWAEQDTNAYFPLIVVVPYISVIRHILALLCFTDGGN